MRESGIHPMSPKTPAPQYQPIVGRKGKKEREREREKKGKGKKVEYYSRDRAA